MMLVNRMFPAATFEDLRREMDRVMNAFTRQPNGRAFGAGTFPPVNVWEDGQAYFVEAEIPGVDLEAIDLQVVGNELAIKGRRDLPEVEGTTFHRRERASGEFGRLVTLPADVDAEKVVFYCGSGVTACHNLLAAARAG
ncbi:MAG: Hsp20 family protein, partial [Kiloniellales bacterium]|nr:Hsp20 family protein [Kiloniellales bacterium]